MRAEAQPEREHVFDPTPSPPRTLEDGARVVVEGDIGDYDGANYVPSGAGAGIVLGYATPELKRSQAWPAESYLVRFDFDPPDSQRVIDRRRLIPSEKPQS